MADRSRNDDELGDCREEEHGDAPEPERQAAARGDAELLQAEAERALAQAEDPGGAALVVAGERQRLLEDLAFEEVQLGAARGDDDRRRRVAAGCRPQVAVGGQRQVGGDDEAALADAARSITLRSSRTLPSQ